MQELLMLIIFASIKYYIKLSVLSELSMYVISAFSYCKLTILKNINRYGFWYRNVYIKWQLNTTWAITKLHPMKWHCAKYEDCNYFMFTILYCYDTRDTKLFVFSFYYNKFSKYLYKRNNYVLTLYIFFILYFKIIFLLK